MIRKILRLVPDSQRSVLPVYIGMIVMSALAQSTAYVMLVPLLETLFSGDLATAWGWLGAITAAVVLVCVGGYKQAVLGIRIGTALQLSLQTRLGDHIAALPLGWFGPSTAGRTSRLISSNVRDVMGVFADRKSVV